MSALRRYKPMTPSRGTVIPMAVRTIVRVRDGGCVAKRAGIDTPCFGYLEMDHVRTGGTGAKSASTPENLVQLCALHHRWKTEHGREARPLLLQYLSQYLEDAA